MTFFLILINTLLGALGSLFLKFSTKKEHASMFNMILSFDFMLGTFFYLVAIAMNIILLRYVRYIVFINSLSFTYIWTLFLSHFFLGEKITPKKILSIAFIMIGVFLVTL